MCDRKSQVPEMVRSMVHGKPSRGPCSDSAIYEVFNWNEPPGIEKQQQIQHCGHHPTTLCQHTNAQPPNHRQECLSRQQNHIEQEYQVGRHKLKPHQIKNELYMYEPAKVKRGLSEEAHLNLNEPKHNIQPQRLDEKSEKDRKIIAKRKQKIKQFKQCTRDLPNSAFTTYYGRPAFQSYGRCNSSSHLRTHNVMPHRGDNHPKVKQTYQSALIKAKNVKLEDHLPRKPIQQCKIKQTGNKKQESKIQLPLEKPDLINHVRFSQPRPKSDHKQGVPSYKELISRSKRTAKAQSPRTQKKKKENGKASKSAADVSDGLKFMNTRDHLIELIEAKKTRDSRVAYKVTECYPTVALERSKTESDCDEMQRAAGVAYQRGDPAERVIYRRY